MTKEESKQILYGLNIDTFDVYYGYYKDDHRYVFYIDSTKYELCYAKFLSIIVESPKKSGPNIGHFIHSCDEFKTWLMNRLMIRACD